MEGTKERANQLFIWFICHSLQTKEAKPASYYPILKNTSNADASITEAGYYIKQACTIRYLIMQKKGMRFQLTAY